LASDGPETNIAVEATVSYHVDASIVVDVTHESPLQHVETPAARDADSWR
jgi:hypothetical protein